MLVRNRWQALAKTPKLLTVPRGGNPGRREVQARNLISSHYSVIRRAPLLPHLPGLFELCSSLFRCLTSRYFIDKRPRNLNVLLNTSWKLW